MLSIMYALHWYANQHIRMISEGSRGTKDWSDDAENKECDPLCENPAKVFFFCDLLFSTKNHPPYGKEHCVKM